MGMLFGLGAIWTLTEILHRNKEYEHKRELSVINILRKVDVPTVFFFLGILTAVASLQSAGHLSLAATWLDDVTGQNIYVIDTFIGIFSAIVDNVPLVAGSMGMYEIAHAGAFAQDGVFWELLAFTAGTGGSILIIGSAAGVAAMGMEKIDFVWYMKKMSLLALVGYFAGIGTYWAQEHIIGAEEEAVSDNVRIVEERATGVIDDATTVHLDVEMFIGTKQVVHGDATEEAHATITEEQAVVTEEVITEEVVAEEVTTEEVETEEVVTE